MGLKKRWHSAGGAAFANWAAVAGYFSLMQAQSLMQLETVCGPGFWRHSSWHRALHAAEAGDGAINIIDRPSTVPEKDANSILRIGAPCDFDICFTVRSPQRS